MVCSDKSVCCQCSEDVQIFVFQKRELFESQFVLFPEVRVVRISCARSTPIRSWVPENCLTIRNLLETALHLESNLCNA